MTVESPNQHLVKVKVAKMESDSSSESEALKQQASFLCLQLSQIKDRTLKLKNNQDQNVRNGKDLYFSNNHTQISK